MPLPTRSQSVRDPQNSASRLHPPQAGMSFQKAEGLSSTTIGAPHVPRFSRPVLDRSRNTEGDTQFGHARTGSLSTSRIPQSLHQARGSTRQPRGVDEADAIADSTSGRDAQQFRPPAPSNVHTRSQSQHSSSVKSQIPSTSSSSSRDQARTRPNFDSYQQHFSPKRTLHLEQTQKPLRPASSTTRADALSNAEAQDLQDELLQLSLIHEQASRCQGTFKATARRKVENQRSSVRKRYDEVVDLEKQYRRHQDLEAVTSWLDVDEHVAASDKVSGLSVCIAEIDEITSNGSTLDRLLHLFELWRAKADQTLHRQQKHPTDTDASIDFIESLDRELLSGLSLAHGRLTICRRTLSALGGAQRTSSLGRVLERHTVLVEVLLEEIETCQALHKSIMTHQEAWIASSIANIVPSQTITRDDDPNPRKGIWE